MTTLDGLEGVEFTAIDEQTWKLRVRTDGGCWNGGVFVLEVIIGTGCCNDFGCVAFRYERPPQWVTIEITAHPNDIAKIAQKMRQVFEDF
jgi:hypothetical protein